jgi:hypothetical protein
MVTIHYHSDTLPIAYSVQTNFISSITGLPSTSPNVNVLAATLIQSWTIPNSINVIDITLLNSAGGILDSYTLPAPAPIGSHIVNHNMTGYGYTWNGSGSQVIVMDKSWQFTIK